MTTMIDEELSLSEENEDIVDDWCDLPSSMVERMTIILELFDQAERRLSLEEVVGRTRLPRSTTHRILRQLVRLDWLNRTSSGYALGLRSLALGGGGSSHTALRAAAFPWLNGLAIRTGTAVHLAVWSGSDVEYLDKLGGRAALRVPSRVGARIAPHTSSLGLAMLAWAAPNRMDDLYDGGDKQPLTLSAEQMSRLRTELRAIRERGGIALVRDEWPGSLDSVALALRVEGRVVGAISLTANRQFEPFRLATLVQEAAGAIQGDLEFE